MPGNFSDTSAIVAANEVASAAIKAAIDALDNEAKALATAASGGAATGFRNLLLNPSFETWENGITIAPDNWVGSCAQEATTIKHGLYSLALTRAGFDVQVFQEMITILGAAYLANRTLTLGAWVWASAGNRARLFFHSDGGDTFSAYHSGSSNWEFLTLSRTLASVVTGCRVGLQVDSAATIAYPDAAILVEGGVLYGFSDSAPSFNQAPKRADLYHDEATVVAGNALALTISTAQMHNGWYNQNASAQNDAFTQSFWLAAGIYTFSVLGSTGALRAQVDWYIDGERVITAQDWYAASQVVNVVKTATVTVKGDGYHVLKGIVATRNASNTTGWFMTLTKYWFRQSAD